MIHVNVMKNPEITRNMRAWLNGKEVTGRAFEMKAPRWPLVPWFGTVGMYVMEDGKHVIVDGNLICEWRNGIVWWKRIKL